MTSRERVELAIRFEQPDRVPFNFWMDRRRMAELDEKYGHDFRLTRYGADVIESFACFPPFPRAPHVEQDGTSWMTEELFTDWSEAKDLPMPDPKDPAIYALLENHLANHSDKAIIVNSPGVLTIIEMMKKQENFYIDLCMFPDEIKAFFERVSDVMAGVAEIVCKRDITALYVQDDIACNTGLLISPEQLEEFVVPYWKKVMDVAHAHEKPIFFHSDGKVDEAYELFDRLGVRMLNPLQPELQDIGVFKEQYHGRMGLYGGLETRAIHSMTPGELRAHVREAFDKAGPGGGLIISSHDMDYSVSEEQLDAMVDEIKRCTY